MNIVAFDIDGALTDDGAVGLYRRTQHRRNVKVGIVTARTKRSAQEFVQETDLDTDFLMATQFKGQALQEVENMFSGDVEQKIYYGSWARDRLHARIAGWEYKQL